MIKVLEQDDDTAAVHQRRTLSFYVIIINSFVGMRVDEFKMVATIEAGQGQERGGLDRVPG